MINYKKKKNLIIVILAIFLVSLFAAALYAIKPAQTTRVIQDAGMSNKLKKQFTVNYEVKLSKQQKDIQRLNSQFVQFKKEKAGNAASPLHQYPNTTIKPIMPPTPTMAPTMAPTQSSLLTQNYQINKLVLIIAIVLFLIICIFILILDSKQDRITEKLAKLANIISVS